MLLDEITLLLILIIVPLLAIVVFRRIAKTKRVRRPVRNFSLK